MFSVPSPIIICPSVFESLRNRVRMNQRRRFDVEWDADYHCVSHDWCEPDASLISREASQTVGWKLSER